MTPVMDFYCFMLLVPSHLQPEKLARLGNMVLTCVQMMLIMSMLLFRFHSEQGLILHVKIVQSQQ